MFLIHSTDFIIQGIIGRGIFDYFTKSQKTNAEFREYELENDKQIVIGKQDICVDNYAPFYMGGSIETCPIEANLP